MATMNDYHKVNILGIDLDALKMGQLIDICDNYIQDKKKLLLGVVNVAKVVNARKNPELRHSLDEADLILADGLPVVWLSRLMGTPLPERVAGIDIMYRLLERANEHHYRVYFLGAKDEVISKVVEIVRSDYPNVEIAGWRNGYFDESQEQGVAQSIGESNADILFVAMTSPKKENFLRQWQDTIQVTICHGVGGSFDVMAGVTERAPLWMQKTGLEWFYRLIQEPRRMWKRYLVTNTLFMVLGFRAIIQTQWQRVFCK
jgi:N-acetylglucosaminyldiphosphoundecaprenol N-acetyl-beta-D-mannosaminyltransferase